MFWMLSSFSLCRTLVLPSVLISLACRIDVIVLQTYSTISHSPLPTHKKTHPWSSHFSPGTVPFLCLTFQQHFSKESITWTLFSCPYLPFIAKLLRSGFQSRLTALKLWPCSAVISVLAHPVDTFQFSSYKSQLHWPNWPVVSAGNTLCFAYVFVFLVPLRPLLISVIFPCSSSCPTEVPELLTSWLLAFLSLNTHASDITHCLGFRYYPYAFPSLLPVVETFLLNSILVYHLITWHVLFDFSQTSWT